jgi:hypothetical protein
MQIFIHRDGQQLGPFTEAEVKAQLASGALSPRDHVWWEGQAGWVPLGQSPLAAPMATSSPPIYLPPVPAPGRPGLPRTPVHAQPTSSLAIASLICALLGLICSIFTAIPAIILGHLALVEIKRIPATPGKGLALAGLIIGYILTGLFVLGAVAATVEGLAGPADDVLKRIGVPFTSEQSNPNDETDSSSVNSDESTNASDASTNDAPVVNP